MLIFSERGAGAPDALSLALPLYAGVAPGLSPTGDQPCPTVGQLYIEDKLPFLYILSMYVLNLSQYRRCILNVILYYIIFFII